MPDKTNFILRFMLFAVVHSLFATAWAKKILHAEGRQGYRLAYNIASLIIFGWVMSAYRNSKVLYFVPGVWSLIMYLLQLVVAVILVGCLRQTGAGEFLGITKLRTSSFTNTGWYSLVRHPLYFFSTLFLLLNPVMTEQWLILTIMGTAYFVLGGLIEEKRLVEEFGESYRHYQQRVPFIIPNRYFTLSAFIILAVMLPSVSMADFFKYKDDGGNLIITNRWEDVPVKYRKRVKVVWDKDLAAKDPVARRSAAALEQYEQQEATKKAQQEAEDKKNQSKKGKTLVYELDEKTGQLIRRFE